LFNSEDDNKEEISFADAYKSQILNKDDEEETSSKNLIIILLLVAIVIGLSIFGYIYMSKMSQSEVQNSEVKKVKVIKEITEEEPPKSNMLNNINELIDEEPTEERNLDNSEIDTSKNSNTKKDKVEVKENKKGVKQKGEETYLEQLAELSKEIDGEAKKK